MRISLLDHTGAGFSDPYYAADILIFSKNTRTKMAPDARMEIASWPEDKKLAELEYIANTIPGSWEFVSYTFMLEGVTRSLTHQLVRTRTASYAQQTMQILDVGDFSYKTGDSVAANPQVCYEYESLMAKIAAFYRKAVDAGCQIADVRECLPTGIHTNIIMKANLRTLVDLFHSRISPRNLGEIRDVCVLMREEMLRVHPWAHLFLDKTADRATSELDRMIRDHVPGGAMVPGTPCNKMLKLVDQLRRKG